MKRIWLVIALIFAITCCSACSYRIPDGILQLDTPEKVAVLYHANEKYFNDAAKVIVGYPDERISVRPMERVQNEALAPSIYIGEDIDGLYIESMGTLTNQDYQRLSKVFAPLMEQCGFSGVVMYASRVQFVLEGPIYGVSAELFYFQDPIFAEEYTSQITDPEYLCIEPHWYAIIWHD